VSSLKYWLWLAELPQLTNQTRLSLLEHFSSPEEIFYADAGEILLTEGITREQASLLANKSLDAAETIMEQCGRLDYRILTMQDADYPGRLRNIFDPPCVLYIRGHLPVVDEEVAVAAVGTRSCTPYGVRCAEKIGSQLASGGALLVTGLARGVDSEAAFNALRCGGRVIGVLGCGLDVVYPPENRSLFNDVAAVGALVSEYAPGTEPKGSHFPVRNRIISGLSNAVVVIEAPEKSGALITAATALEQGRDVFAVPGPIDATQSRGCNRLIRDGAGLVSDAWDILETYEAQYPGKLKREEARREVENPGYRERSKPLEPAKQLPPELNLSDGSVELTDDQIAILRTLTDEPMLADDLIERTQIPTRRVLSALTMLEVDGYVHQASGKRYIRGVMLLD
jgi:DNA processing protein